jgi:toxin secretion/phage lysis holin
LNDQIGLPPSTITMISSLILLMVLDVIGGLCVAFAMKQISSTVSYQGMAKKVGTFLAIGAVAIVDKNIHLPVLTIPLIGLKLSAPATVVLFYLVNESISVLEKAAKLKAPLPARLVDALAKLKGESRTTVKVAIVPDKSGSTAELKDGA